MRQLFFFMALLLSLTTAASDGSTTWSILVTGGDTLTRDWLPAQRTIYGTSKIVTQFDNEQLWDEDMKGAFLYACQIVEEVIPTSYPLRVKARLVPTNSNAPSTPVLSEVVSHKYNYTYGNHSTNSFQALSSRIKASKFYSDTRMVYDTIFNSMLTVGLFTSSDVEVNIRLYDDMSDIYSYSIANECATGRYDFVSMVIRSLMKGFGFFVDFRDAVNVQSQTLDLSQYKPLNYYDGGICETLSYCDDNHEAYQYVTGGSFQSNVWDTLYAPVLWNDDLSMNYYTGSGLAGNYISRVLKLNYGKGSVLRCLQDVNTYGWFRHLLCWRGAIALEEVSDHWLDEFTAFTHQPVPYHGMIHFDAPTQNLELICPTITGNPMQFRTTTHRASATESNEVRQYLKQYHPNYTPDGQTTHEGYAVAIQLKDGTWDVLSYGSGTTMVGDSINTATFLLNNDIGAYARTCDGYLKCRVTHHYYDPQNVSPTNNIYHVKYFLLAWLPQKVQLSERRGVDYDDDEYYARDLVMTLSGLEGATHVYVSQQEEGDPFPFTYEITDFKSGSFIATVDKELYTTLRVMAINANGSTLSDTYTIAPVLGDGLSFNMQFTGSSITLTPRQSRLSDKQLLESYVIQPVELTGTASARSQPARSAVFSGNTIDISGLPRGMYVLKVTDTRGRQHQYKFSKP